MAAPNLYVIHTPPEMHARWQTWLGIKRALLATLLITAFLLALIYMV
jgi:hypothetical protein